MLIGGNMMHLADTVASYFVGRLPISPRWTIVVIIAFGRFAPIRRSSADKHRVEARQFHDTDRLEIVHAGEGCTVDTERDKVFKRDFGLQRGHFNGHASRRIAPRDRIPRRVHVPVQLDRVPCIERPRVAAEEAPHDRIILPRPQGVLLGRGVVALTGIQVRGERVGDVLQQVAKGCVGIGLGDCAAGVGQGANAALSVGEGVAGCAAACLREQVTVCYVN